MHNQSRTAALILGSLSWRLDGSNDSADLCHYDATSAFINQRYEACIRRALKGLAYVAGVDSAAYRRAETVRVGHGFRP